MATEKRYRPIPIKLWVTDTEYKLIEQKMSQFGTSNMSAYLRKMAIDGYVLKLDLPELKELISLLRRCSNNLNQVAKRTNETGRIYSEDLDDIAKQLDGIWEVAKQIMTELAKVS